MAELMPWEDPPAPGTRTKEAMPWEDPEESVTSRVVRYDMPEPPGPPKIAALQPDAPGPPGFLQRAWEQTGGAVVPSILGALVDPKRQLQETIAGLTARNIEAARNPVQVQPGPATPFIEDVRTGNWPGLAGDVTGLAINVFGPKVLAETPRVIRATPTAVKGAAKGAYKAGTSRRTAGEAGLSFGVGLVGGPQAAAATQTALTGTRMAIGAVKGAREALNARALRAAEALAAERAAAEQAAAAARPQPIPEARRIEPPPDTSYVRAVPADPLPPSRQLPPPGRPPIITPAPDPLAGDTSGVRAVPAVYGSSAVNEAAAGVREVMGLQPGEFATPIIKPELTGVDRMARMLLKEGITSKEASKIQPPQLKALAQAIGAEGPLLELAGEVRKQMAKIEKAQAETAKWQAAWARTKEGEKAAVRAAWEPDAAPAAAETPALTPAEALKQEMGYQPPETAAPKPVLSGPERRIQGLGELLATAEKSTADLEAGFRSEEARLYLQNRSEKLGYGKPAAGEIPRILDKVRELRGEGAKPAPQPAEMTAPIEQQPPETGGGFEEWSREWDQAVKGQQSSIEPKVPAEAPKAPKRRSAEPAGYQPKRETFGSNVYDSNLWELVKTGETVAPNTFGAKTPHYRLQLRADTTSAATRAAYDRLMSAQKQALLPNEMKTIRQNYEQLLEADKRSLAKGELPIPPDVVRKPPAEAKAIVEKAQRARRKK